MIECSRNRVLGRSLVQALFIPALGSLFEAPREYGLRPWVEATPFEYMDMTGIELDVIKPNFHYKILPNKQLN
jgi:hypothetical protein